MFVYNVFWIKNRGKAPSKGETKDGLFLLFKKMFFKVLVCTIFF